jgi:hypothetical protein
MLFFARMKSVLRLLVQVLAYIVLAAVVFLVLPALLSVVWDKYRGFDRADWVAVGRALQQHPDSLKIINNREYMAADVVAHYLKPGMSRQKVISLLGEPDNQYQPQDSLLADYLPLMHYYIYYNGSHVGALTITLTPRQRVVRYAAQER